MLGTYVTNVVGKPLTIVQDEEGRYHLLATPSTISPIIGSDLVEFTEADVIVSGADTDAIGHKLNHLLAEAACAACGDETTALRDGLCRDCWWNANRLRETAGLGG